MSRYVVSFTSAAGDVTDVLELAEPAVGGREPLALDVVPLFESSDALTAAGSTLDALFAR